MTKLEGWSLGSASCGWGFGKELIKNCKVCNVKRHPSMKPYINLHKFFPFLNHIFILQNLTACPKSVFRYFRHAEVDAANNSYVKNGFF